MHMKYENVSTRSTQLQSQRQHSHCTAEPLNTMKLGSLKHGYVCKTTDTIRKKQKQIERRYQCSARLPDGSPQPLHECAVEHLNGALHGGLVQVRHCLVALCRGGVHVLAIIFVHLFDTNNNTSNICQKLNRNSGQDCIHITRWRHVPLHTGSAPWALRMGRSCQRQQGQSAHRPCQSLDARRRRSSASGFASWTRSHPAGRNSA